MATDDGIIARLPDTGDDDFWRTITAAAFPDASGVRDAVAQQVAGSALFAARFRECAARALLLPRRDPGKRTPLWQQRQRSAQLLAVASRYPTFPIVLEAMRECLQDVYDLPALESVLVDVSSGRIAVVEVETARPSPFAQSLLWSYVATYLYEGDSPLADKRAAALALDPQLLASLLGDAQLRDLLDEEALLEVEQDLQLLSERRRVRTLDQAADAYRALGPMTPDEAARRGVDDTLLAELMSTRRVFETRLSGVGVHAAIEDAARLRDALGAPLPHGIPVALLTPVADAVGDVVGRYSRTHGPFTAEQAGADLNLGPAVVLMVLRQLAGRHRVVSGEFRPGGAGAEWCDADVLRRIRRLSAARLRQQLEPVEQQALGRFLPRWSQVAPAASPPTLRGADGVYSVLEQLAGVAQPASAWERWILPSRVASYESHWLDELTSAGEVVWWGTATLPGRDGWVAFAPTDLASQLRVDSLLPEAPEDSLSNALLDVLNAGGGWFFGALLERLGTTPSALSDALWGLVWSGRVFNDSFSPVRAYLGGATSARGAARRRPGSGRVPPTVVGRWSAPSPAPPTAQSLTAAVERIVARHGLVIRGSLAVEAFPGGFAAAYKILSALADNGRLTRLHLVEGLGGAQFAAPSVVDRIRELAGQPPVADTYVLAATDPANPYGAALAWPSTSDAGHRPGRKAGALVVLVDGLPGAYLEKGGRSLLLFRPEDAGPALAALAGALISAGPHRTAIQRIDGKPFTSLSPAELDQIAAAGFHLTPSGLRVKR